MKCKHLSEERRGKKIVRPREKQVKSDIAILFCIFFCVPRAGRANLWIANDSLITVMVFDVSTYLYV